MKRNQLLPQPDFIPEFEQWEGFEGTSIGITGQQGLLGGMLYKRFAESGIRINAYPSDILDNEKLESWFQGKQFSHFLHFAAVVPVVEVEKDPLKAFGVNAIGVFNLIKQIERTQNDCWVFTASSSHIYKPSGISPISNLTVNSKSDPSNFYGESKRVGELIAHYLLEELSIPYCIGRIFSFTHLNQKEPYLVPTLIKKIDMLKNGETLHLINPESVRDIMDAESVIDAILYLAVEKYKGIINIGSGTGLNVKQVAELLIDKFGRNLLFTGENTSEPNSLVADVVELRKIIESIYKRGG